MKIYNSVYNMAKKREGEHMAMSSFPTQFYSKSVTQFATPLQKEKTGYCKNLQTEKQQKKFFKFAILLDFHCIKF